MLPLRDAHQPTSLRLPSEIFEVESILEIIINRQTSSKFILDLCLSNKVFSRFFYPDVQLSRRAKVGNNVTVRILYSDDLQLLRWTSNNHSNGDPREPDKVAYEKSPISWCRSSHGFRFWKTDNILKSKSEKTSETIDQNFEKNLPIHSISHDGNRL